MFIEQNTQLTWPRTLENSKRTAAHYGDHTETYPKGTRLSMQIHLTLSKSKFRTEESRQDMLQQLDRMDGKLGKNTETRTLQSLQ